MVEATCVDKNERALRFTRFHSILDGFCEKITQIGDLSQLLDENNPLLCDLKKGLIILLLLCCKSTVFTSAGVR